MIKIMLGRNYQKVLKQAEADGYYNALMLVKRVLESPEGKIITQPQTLVGDGQTITDSVFIGCEPAIMAHRQQPE